MGMMKTFAMLILLPAFISCGGGGGGASSSSTTISATDGIEITGIASKGLINFAAIKCYFSSTGSIPEDMIPTVGDTVSIVPVDTDGRYSCFAPKNTKTVGTIVIPSNISIMKDEATGEDITVPLDFKLRGVTDLAGSTQSKIDLHITPLSEAAVSLAVKNGGLSTKLINQANSGISNLLGFDNLSTKPIQVSNAQALLSASDAEKQMSVANAAISSMAANDALLCGAKSTYGQSISCTVAKFTDQFSIANANVNSAPSTASFTSTGSDNFLSATAKVIKDSTVAAVKSVEMKVISAAKTVETNISLTKTALLGQQSKEQYRNLMAGDNYLINIAQDPTVYDFALLSAKVYEKTWTNGNLRAFNNFENIYYTDPISNYTYKTLNKYNVINWNEYPEINKETANLNELQWNIFYNDEYFVFAYRGSENPFTHFDDWSTNIEALKCAKIAPQYNVALTQFKNIIGNSVKFKTLLNNKTIYLTGHSLGGGIASYIATQFPSGKAVAFNPAPVNPSPTCNGQLERYTNDSYSNISRYLMDREPLANFFDIGSFLGASERFANPINSTAIYQAQNHSINTMLFVLDATRLAVKSQVQTPVNLIVTGIPASFTPTLAPFRPLIPISGSRFSAIEKIIWECKLPNGSACVGSPYIWTQQDANWSSKAIFDTANAGSLYPRLLSSDDAAGIYQWVVTFSGGSQTSVSKSFSVNYQPTALTSISVTGMTSAQFASGSTAISTAEKSYIPSISVTGQNLDKVVGVEWRWSGAAAGSASWAKTDSSWSTKVSLVDGKLVLKPTVVEANPAWSGTIIWTGTLKDASGSSKNITFSVTYKPASQTQACILPQVAQGNQCVTPAVVCTSPLVLQNGVCVAVAQNSVTTPAISSLSFTSVVGDEVGRTLTITGSNFSSGNIVSYRWLNPVGSNAATATVATTSQLSASFNPGKTADTIFVKVCKASGSTICSSELSVAVTAPPVVAPVISALSLTSAIGDGVDRTLTITGSNFTSGNVVSYRWLNPVGSKVVNATVATTSQLSTIFNPGKTLDTIFVKVCKASGSTVCSSELSVAVTVPAAPAPTVNSSNTNVTHASSGSQPVAIVGSGFTSNSWHQLSTNGGSTWDDANSAPYSITSTSMTVAVNATLTVGTNVRIRVCSVQASNGVNCSTGFATAVIVAAAVVTPSLSSVSTIAPYATTCPSVASGCKLASFTLYGSHLSGASDVQKNWGYVNGGTSSSALVSISSLSDTSISLTAVVLFDQSDPIGRCYDWTFQAKKSGVLTNAVSGGRLCK